MKASAHLFAYRSFNLAGILCLLMLTGCGSRTAPAPVVELYQGKDYRDFEADAFSGKEYVVQKGDTLFSIAWHSGQDYRDIARWNNIGRPYRIYPGQQLTVQKSSPISTTSRSPQPGQTTKIKPKQAVDRPEKQAYGEVKGRSKKPQIVAKTNPFPQQVSTWNWPANGKVLNGFSLVEKGNKGIDIQGQKSDPIYAAADGKVVYTGNALRGYGNLVIIKHSETFLSAYAHTNTIKVKEQQWVKVGQQIASMGSSGTDSVKLHFEVRYKGKSVDPLRYLPRR